MIFLETAVASEADAERLARGLLAAKLAACVSILGQRSIYHWQGRVHDEPEWLLRCKTTPERLGAASAWLREHHPYEVPELVSYSAEVHNPDYAKWLEV